MLNFFQNLLKGGGSGSNILRYPYEALSSATDYLQIDVLEYVPVSKNSQNTNGANSLVSSPGSRRNSLNNRVGYRSIGGLTNRVLKDGGTILLQIPSQVQDGNSASYGDSRMNGLVAAAAQGATDIMSGIKLDDLGGSIQEVGTKLAETKNNALQGAGGVDGIKDITTKFLTSKAVGALGGNVSVNQLLARQSGEIFNPNMELLFNGPTLRSFRFSFKMTPRSSAEAEQIKLIIRSFKRNMAPKTAAAANKSGSRGNFFLKSPNIFELRYRSGNQDHPFLHKFKQCFLTDVSVNYTGEGVYATYEDATPVSMILDLSFKELEPVYDVDYDSEQGQGGVGY